MMRGEEERWRDREKCRKKREFSASTLGEFEGHAFSEEPDGRCAFSFAGQLLAIVE